MPEKQTALRLATFGCDEDVLEIVETAIQQEGWDLVACHAPDTYRARLQALALPAEVGEHWESLLSGEGVDAVIVAARTAQDESHDDALRKLVNANLPLLVVMPACEAIVGFELDMIRADHAGIIRPYYKNRQHAVWRQFVSLLRDRGEITQLVFERRLADEDQLVRDIDMIQAIAGPIQKVSAMGSQPEDGTLRGVSINMTSESGILVRWTNVPLPDADARLSAYTASGEVALTISTKGAWSLESGKTPLEPVDASAESSVSFVLREFEQSVRTRQDRGQWMSVCRAMDIAEIVPTCLRRGKTMEFHNEQHSEASSFKGIMAAGGCGMLLLTLATILVAAAVEALHLPFRHHLWWKLWPVYLVVPILIFLALQLLQLVAGDADGSSPITTQTK